MVLTRPSSGAKTRLVFTDDKQKITMRSTGEVDDWVENDNQMDNYSSYFIVIPPRCYMPYKQITTLIQDHSLRPSLVYFITTQLCVDSTYQTPYALEYEEDLRKTCGDPPHNTTPHMSKYSPSLGLLKMNHARRMHSYLNSYNKHNNPADRYTFNPDYVDIISAIKVFLPGTSPSTIISWCVYPKKEDRQQHKNLRASTPELDSSASHFNQLEDDTRLLYPIWLNKESVFQKTKNTDPCVFLAGNIEYPTPVLMESIYSIPYYALFNNSIESVPFASGLTKRYSFALIAFVATLINYIRLCVKTLFVVGIPFAIECMILRTVLYGFLNATQERGMIMFLVQFTLTGLLFYYTPYRLNQLVAQFPIKYYSVLKIPSAVIKGNRAHWVNPHLISKEGLYQGHALISIALFRLCNYMFLIKVIEAFLMVVIILIAPIKGIIGFLKGRV
jgi:hypothetical protein